MSDNHKLLSNYVNAAADLAESVKAELVSNNGMISDATVLKLNAFIIAMNEVQYLLEPITKKTKKLN